MKKLLLIQITQYHKVLNFLHQKKNSQLFFSLKNQLITNGLSSRG